MHDINWPQSDNYLLAVSGGVDSVVLLHAFADVAADRSYSLSIAHFDHVMRADSAADAAFVEQLAAQFNLPFYSGRAQSDLHNEADARQARYDFLRATAVTLDAAVITAHHQDDVIETSLLNLARGTGRTGLVPFTGTDIIRPLSGCSRADILAYADQHKLTWHEDPTNQDRSNPRNFVRHNLLPAADPAWRLHYLDTVAELATLNRTIDRALAAMIKHSATGVTLDRMTLARLPQVELTELIVAAVRAVDPTVELSRRLVGELAVFAVSARTGTHRPIRGPLVMSVQKATVSIGKTHQNRPH